MDQQLKYYLSLKSLNDKLIQDLKNADQYDQLQKALETEDYIVYKIYKLTGKIPCKAIQDFLPQESDETSYFAATETI